MFLKVPHLMILANDVFSMLFLFLLLLLMLLVLYLWDTKTKTKTKVKRKIEKARVTVGFDVCDFFVVVVDN